MLAYKRFEEIVVAKNCNNSFMNLQSNANRHVVIIKHTKVCRTPF